jgi:hypothetical protein
MSFTALVEAALLDPFRIGLLVALFATMWRTRAATGVLLPLALGAVFVALVLPMTLPGEGPFATRAAAGFVANLLWLTVIAALFTAYQRLSSK